MTNTSPRNRPAYQSVAGRIARVFGVQFYDLCYGQRDLSPPSESVVPTISIEVRRATTEELDRIVRRIGGGARGGFDHNIAINSTCYIAIHEGTVTGFLWVNRQVADLVGMHVAKLPAGHSFSHNAFIFPEYRGNKIYQYLRQAVCNELYESGCVSIACFVDKANTQPINVLKREGMEFHNAPVLKIPFINPIHFCRVLV